MTPALVEPIRLRAHLRAGPTPGFDATPFVDVLCIALFIALAGSRFIFAPGVAIDLARVPSLETQAAAPAAVLTIDRNQLVFFDGVKIPVPAIEDTLRAWLRQAGGRDPVLLVKADVSMGLDELFRLLDIARRAGFVRVHLAAEDIWSEMPPFPEGGEGGVAR
jgi:biopolymer transport protein ExbD